MSPAVGSARAERYVVAGGLVASIAVISALHYAASAHVAALHAVLVHETLKRLYYVPIVIAATYYGVQGGLATSLLSSALYLPHIVLTWSNWPVFEVGQYGEIVLFNVVGAVTGIMADRLRSERNRYRETSEELEAAYRQLEASTDRRVSAERMAAVGRVAAGVAHEIRTPLSAILGCFEILAVDYPSDHPKAQFIEILKKEIARAEGVVTTFLDFAQPAVPRLRSVDVNDTVRAAARRFSATRTDPNRPAPRLEMPPSPVFITADAQQLERSIVELLVTASALAPREAATVSTARTADGGAEIRLFVTGLAHRISEDLFDTFDDRCCTNALMLPLIRKLLENQGGSVTASSHDSSLSVIISFPRIASAAQPIFGAPTWGSTSRDTLIRTANAISSSAARADGSRGTGR